ncbi:MAG: hypothetical protein KAU94_03375, partial [Verrucomicrobia bacterium]|nr:hypothetical protein [Verrucomicrobiota bacterium]
QASRLRYNFCITTVSLVFVSQAARLPAFGGIACALFPERAKKLPFGSVPIPGEYQIPEAVMLMRCASAPSHLEKQ